MPYLTSTKCKICTSKYRVEIEELRVKESKTFQELSDHLKDKHGLHISAGAVHRHFQNHFDYVSDEMALVQTASRQLYKENLVDAGNRAAKLSGMIHASYEYVTTHFNELDMKTALQMLFGSIDQLNKMEGTGAFAGGDFLMKFQEMLDMIKRGNPVQPTLIYDADVSGEATPDEANTKCSEMSPCPPPEGDG